MSRSVLVALALEGCFSKPDPPRSHFDAGNEHDPDAADAMGSDGATPWLAGYAWRRRITVHRTAQPMDTLTNFPVSLVLTGDAMLSARTLSMQDITFTAGDGTTPLKSEIVSFQKLPGNLEAWVQLPSVPLGPTSFYMYYAGVPVPATGGQAWSSALAVWHMNGTDQTEIDSRGHVTPPLASPSLDATPTSVAGVVGNARAYDGVEDSLCTSTGFLPIGTNSFSVSLWMEADDTAPGTPFYRMNGGDSGDGVWVDLGSTWVVHINGTTLSSVVSIGDPDTTWLQLAVVYDASAGIASVYRNATTSLTFSVAPGTIAAPTRICIGDATRFFAGTIDEVRFYLGAVSQAWFATEHENVTNRSSFMTEAVDEFLQ